MASQYLLEMKQISKLFGGVVQALDTVDFSVRPGTIHGLVGENGAGKSTLMKILFGMHQKDSGEIKLNEKTVNFSGPYDALTSGISMVHQELDLVPERTVMENIWLGRFPKKFFLIDKKKMYRDTKELFDMMDVNIKPDAIVSHLPVSSRQITEICKAVSYDSNIIVMDEPTSSLTEKEVDKLMGILKTLREQGRGVVYISHKLDEIKHITDDITILRDGKMVNAGLTKDYEINDIISHMVGRDMEHIFPEKTNVVSHEVKLEVKNLSGMGKNTIKDVSFKLHKGEILGLAGLLGSRRTELVETLFGLRKAESGEIYLEGKKISVKSAKQAIKNGFALVTEERKLNGVFLGLSVGFNALITNLNQFGTYRNPVHLLNNKKMNESAKWVINTLGVRTPNQYERIGKLSGGNQQKVIIGRWLLLDPDILILDDPTRGVDVGAKYEIYQLINDLAKQGKSIIITSSEMNELFGVADRIVVMSNGYSTGSLKREEYQQDTVFKLSAERL
jgi:methyl-galactoside transport system ATP-binding protein